MKRLLLSARGFVLVLSLALLGLSAAHAQTNLLINPGFEPPFNSVGGNNLLQVANGWTPWHVPQGPGDTASENLRPEYLPSTNTSDSLGVPRVRSGADAQQFSTFFGTFQAGVFQRVTGLTTGSTLRFSVYAWIWSSSFEDPALSDEDGGVLMQVGIDPTGGEDGQSAAIVWSSPISLYDGWNEYSITTQASGPAASVWVRALVSVPVQNNVIYLDDAALTTGDGGAVTPTPTSTTAAAVSTNTPLPPTPTNTPLPATNTNTPVPAAPTNTPVSAATNTPQPATNTPLPPTPTNTPLPATNTNTPAPAAPTNTPLPPTPTNTPAPISGDFPGRIIHTVRAGDTVARLATLYGSTTQAIIAANGLDESALIFVGQGLVIPVRLAAPATSTPTPTPVVVVVTATPVPAQPTAVPAQPTPAPGGATTYVVQPGDTLRQIALRFNTTISALAQLNGIANPNLIFVGQTLAVPGTQPPPAPTPTTVSGSPTQPPAPTAAPAPRTYRVQPGENLFRIALRFGVSMRALQQANNITDPNRIFWGQVLVIP